jgi:hypothetical protein
MMNKMSRLILFLLIALAIPFRASAWHDETHLAIAKVAGYKKWYNAAGADIAKIKAGEIEGHNHYSNKAPEVKITPEMVLSQIERYNTIDDDGHLYGAIIASLRDYIREKGSGKYSQYHLAYCIHYTGDLSMPLHNTLHNAFNKKNHITIDGIINDEVLDNLEKIKIYSIKIQSEMDLAKEIARIANLSKSLGYKIEQENRLLTKEEAYTQISHSASLLKAILSYSENATR